MELLGVIVSFIDSFPGLVAVPLLIIVGIVIAFKNLLINRFDFMFMNFLDRNTSTVISNLGLLTIIFALNYIFGMLILTSEGPKKSLVLIELAASVVICLVVWIKNRKKESRRKETRLFIVYYVLMDVFVVILAGLSEYEALDITTKFVQGAMISIIIAFLELVITWRIYMDDSNKSQFYFTDEHGKSYFLHYILREDLMLCTSSGDLSNNPDRFLINIDKIKCIKKAEDKREITYPEQNYKCQIEDKEVNNLSEERTLYDDLINKDEKTENSAGCFKQSFSERLKFLITTFNEGREERFSINIEYLGDFLGLESVNMLEKYLRTSEAPSYQFEEMIANKLGISPQWIKSGYGEPFASPYSETDLKVEPFSLPDQEKAEKVIFAIKNEPNRKSIITVLKLNEFKYMIYPKEFILYRSGGVHGEHELMLTHSMLRSLQRVGKNFHEAYMLSSSEWEDLLEGRIYPGSIERKQVDVDIINNLISPNPAEISRYTEKYGKSYSDAVKFIQDHQSHS